VIANRKESEALRFEELYYKLKRTGTCKTIPLAIFLYEMSVLNNSFNTQENRLSLLVNDIPNLSSKTFNISGLPFGKQVNVKLHQNGSSLFDHRNFASFDDTTNFKYNNNNNNGIIDNNLNDQNLEENCKPFLRKDKIKRQQRPYTIHVDSHESKVNFAEIELLREVLFAFQGLNGRILVADPSNDLRYKINSQYSIPPCERQLVMRLTHIGWLFNKVNKYCEHTLKNETLGYVCQSFASALQEEVQRYYRLVTVIEQELHSYVTDVNNKNGLTLLRLQVYTYDFAYLLKVLTNMIDSCRNKRGGALVHVVYNYSQHGDPNVKSCIRRIMKQVVVPIRQMLNQWIFHGEIEDPYKEFFIATSRSCLESSHEPLWHEMYNLNKLMFPGFISVDQAKKILITGKAVNLVKQIFEDTSYIPGNEILRKSFESKEVELLFNDERKSADKGEFQKLLQSAYHEMSQKALKLLFENYHFMDHLKGLRKFLLLGQGDFIIQLMDLLVHELEKPAQNLKLLNLKNLLNCAIRATNAQFLDEDVIERIDVRFSDSLQETGWDIFTLDYQTTGPINTILNVTFMEHYSSLFKYLWRSKRVEYVLTFLKKKQMKNALITNKFMAKIASVLHYSRNIVSEMIHFIKQMQYYIEFEVLESSWNELIRKIESASDIDQLIEAQENFLSTVISRSMLDAESQNLSEQLRAIYDIIIQFHSVEESLLNKVNEEIETRKTFDEKEFDEEAYQAFLKVETDRRKHFETHIVSDFKLKIQLLSKTYQNMVQKFLLQLAAHQDYNLRFLSFSLDFNEHYAKRNPHLETSFTYSRHRSSLESSLTYHPSKSK